MTNLSFYLEFDLLTFIFNGKLNKVRVLVSILVIHNPKFTGVNHLIIIGYFTDIGKFGVDNKLVVTGL